MTRPPKAPTLARIVGDLLIDAASQTAQAATHLPAYPLGWESTRNALDRVRGLEIAQIVLRDLGLLEVNTLAGMREAMTHLNAASLALSVIGQGRPADALQDTRRAIAQAMETHFPSVQGNIAALQALAPAVPVTG
jgi:hypothetical protein